MKNLTKYQEEVIKAIDLLFVEWGQINIPEDGECNAPTGGYVVCNFIMRSIYMGDRGDADKFIKLLNNINFGGIHCFPAKSGIVIEIFHKNPYLLD